MHLTAAQMDEKQHVMRYELTQRPHLGGKEVSRDQNVEMRADEFLPRRGGHTLWSCWEAMPFQDVTHGLVTDRIAQIGQGADDPVIAPGAVLLCHADDQGLDLLVDHRAAGRLALLRA